MKLFEWFAIYISVAQHHTREFIINQRGFLINIVNNSTQLISMLTTNETSKSRSSSSTWCRLINQLRDFFPLVHESKRQRLNVRTSPSSFQLIWFIDIARGHLIFHFLLSKSNQDEWRIICVGDGDWQSVAGKNH